MGAELCEATKLCQQLRVPCRNALWFEVDLTQLAKDKRSERVDNRP